MGDQQKFSTGSAQNTSPNLTTRERDAVAHVAHFMAAFADWLARECPKQATERLMQQAFNAALEVRRGPDVFGFAFDVGDPRARATTPHPDKEAK